MSSSPFHGIFSSLNQEETVQKRITPQGDEDSTFAQAFGGSAPARDTSGVGRVAVDIYEQDDYYIIKAPIAGVRMSDLDIEVTDNILTIRGNRRQQDDVPESQYYLQECFWGPFSRK